MANKAYKYRLYPTKEQQSLFTKTFGSCRFVYNKTLEYRKALYETEQRSMSKLDCSAYCRQLKAQYPWLREVDKFALDNAVFALDAAYRKFFREHMGYPKFKSRHRSRRSYTTNITANNIRVLTDGIRLPKVGVVKAKIHRMAPVPWKLKSATVSQDGDGKYYCSVLYEYAEDIRPVEVTPKKVLGLDYKTAGLYVDSNGLYAEMPKYYKRVSKRLGKLQRHSLRHKDIHSKNYRKAQRKIAKLHKHVANQRKNFLHTKSAEIANQYDLVCIESLYVKDMVQDRPYRNYRKSVLDNGWYGFTVMLGYKLHDRGKHLVKADPSYPSSQICSHCGSLYPDAADDRIRKWTCPVCGTVHDRDVNAAINIRNEGYRLFLAS